MTASKRSSNGNFLEKGMISFLVFSMAECKEIAKLNFTLSSAILMINFEMPDVDTVILLGDIPRPSLLVILSIPLITLL